MTAVAQPKPKDVIQPTLEHFVEVPKPCTREQVKFFVDQGYLTMPGMITPAELEELKADTCKLARGGYSVPGLLMRFRRASGAPERLPRPVIVRLPGTAA